MTTHKIESLRKDTPTACGLKKTKDIWCSPDWPSVTCKNCWKRIGFKKLKGVQNGN